MLFLFVYLGFSKRIRALFEQASWPQMQVYALAAALISINWGAYIWGVNNGRAIEVSLGYFMMPLVSVMIGCCWFREKLSSVQTAGVLLAAVGVVYLCLGSDTVPWIAFIVALSFCFYGFVKKKATLSAAAGLAIETSLLAVPAMVLILILAWRSELVFLHASSRLDVLLAGTGIVTVIPLLLFAIAAQKIPLSTAGMLQYVSPSLQFMVGYFIFREPLSTAKLVGFAIIWTGLALYIYGVIRAKLRQTGN